MKTYVAAMVQCAKQTDGLMDAELQFIRGHCLSFGVGSECIDEIPKYMEMSAEDVYAKMAQHPNLKNCGR